MDELTEQELVARATSGDLAAFDVLVRRHEGAVRAFFRIRIRDWAAADDLAQEAFLTAYNRLATYRAETHFRAWLRGICLNHLRNFLRKRQDVPAGGGQELQQLIEEHIQLPLDDAFSTAQNGVDEGALLRALKNCLEKVDPRSRDLLNERYVNGRTVKSIAEESERGYSALNMQMMRLRERLALCIRRKLHSEP